MARARKPASPVLGAAMSAIDLAAETLVPQDSRFRHSVEVAVERISPDPDQPRKHFGAADIAALAATMQAEGQLQPVLLRRDPERRGYWILVAGERRWRAAQANGWSSLLAIEHAGNAEIAALVENLQRVDLNPVEEARGIKRLAAHQGMNQARIAALLGRSAAEISAGMRLLSLPDAFLARATVVPRNVLVELARLPEGATRQRLMQQALEGELTVRAIRQAQRPEPVQPSRPSPTSGLLSGLGRALQQLERRQAKGSKLAGAERAALAELRARIDALLEF